MKKLLRWTLIATALTPVIVSGSALVPYVSGKTLWFRGLLALVAILAAALFFRSASFRQETMAKAAALWKRPIVKVIALSYALLVVSTIFAFDRNIAFFGNLERGEGLVGLTFFYLFFLFTSLFFERRHWNRFLCASLVTGWILFFVQVWQTTAEGIVRPPSLAGNPIYLGAYFLFTAYCGVLLYARRRRGESSLPAAAPVLSVLMAAAGMLIAQSRGVLLGAAAALILGLLYLAHAGRHARAWRKVTVRNCAVAALAVFVVFGGVFVATRHAAVWREVPGLDRLSAFNATDSDTQARLVNTEIALHAFASPSTSVERKLFGWGWDNYVYAWERFYEPKLYAIDSGVFDRAHDKLLDVLVMQGALGLAAYLALWAFFIAAIFRLGKRSMLEASATLFFAIAFFIQNLTVFDSFLTYLAFFAVLACVIHDTEPVGAARAVPAPRSSVAFAGAFLAIVAVFSFVAFYSWTLVPQEQTIAFLKDIRLALDDGNAAPILDDAAIFSPDTYAQGILRFEFLSDVEGYYTSHRYQGNDLLLGKAIAEMQAYVAAGPERYDYYLALGNGEYIQSVIHHSDPAYLKLAEEYYQYALTIIPGRQDVLNVYAIVSSDQKK